MSGNNQTNIYLGLCGHSSKMGQEIIPILKPPFILNEIRNSQIKEKKTPNPTQLWIDFSTPKATLALIEEISVPIVIGTTGFSPSELEKIQKESQRIPILMSSNFSLGIDWLTQIIQKTFLSSKHLWNVEILEEHHLQKKDSPSGTALSLKKELEKIGYSSIKIHSERKNNTVGVHTIRLFSEDEEITLTHLAKKRSVFAKGVLEAALRFYGALPRPLF